MQVQRKKTSYLRQPGCILWLCQAKKWKFWSNPRLCIEWQIVLC